MKRKPQVETDLTQVLRTVALRYPEAQEGIACEGTSAEKQTIKARTKAFLFLGRTDAMLKLRDSLAEAADLALKEPSRYKVGAHGWVTVTIGNGESPPIDLLSRWIDESYRLIAARQLVASLPQAELPADAPESTKTKTLKKKVSR